MTPALQLRLGALPAALAAPAAATEVVVDRDLDVPVDVAVLRFAGAAAATPGDAVSVALGVDGAPEPVFVGTVARAGAEVTATRGQLGEVVAFGRLQALVALRVAAVYEQRTLGAVARDLFTRAGVVPGEVDEGPLLPRVAVDARRSAAAHLRDLARRFGREVWADREGRGRVGVPGGAGAAGLAAAATAATASVAGGGVRYGADLLRAAGRRQPPLFDGVEVAGESPASTRGDGTQAWLTTDESAARASAGGSRSRLVLEPLARTRDLAQAVADGLADAATGRSAEVVVTVLGRPEVDLADRVTVAGAPDELLAVTGTVRALRHRLDALSGFTTTLRLALEAPS